MRYIAVIDVGKTNAKLAVVDLQSMSEIAVRTRPNRVLPGPPWPHFDLSGHWDFFCAGLRDFQAQYGIDGVSVTTHGAAITLIGQDDAALPMIDYEFAGPDELAESYDAIRPDFAVTGSPRLPMGLNIGAQLHYMLAQDPDLLARTKAVVTYPQYWGYMLTQETATDVTSLGCHSDLWVPETAQFSPLVAQLGLTGLVAPPRKPMETLGRVTAKVALETGLRIGTPVAVGIHDSNASLLPHVMARQGPFSVVSTGTWVIMMAMKGDPVSLDQTRDTLINVNAFGQAVPSARFMGGREFDLINQGWDDTPGTSDRQAVQTGPILLLPSVVAGSGPFPNRRSGWTNAPNTPGERHVALSYYLALMTATGLRSIGARGPAVIEGPFARNPDYCAMLAQLVPDGVAPMQSATGTSVGAALLLSKFAPACGEPIRAESNPVLAAYAAAWIEAVGRS